MFISDGLIIRLWIIVHAVMCSGFMASHCNRKCGQKWLSPEWHVLKAEFFFLLSRPFVYLERCSSALSFGFCCSWLRQCGPVLLWLTAHYALARLSDILFLIILPLLRGNSEGGTWRSICSCSACTPGQCVSHRICVTVLVCAFKVVAAGWASPPNSHMSFTALNLKRDIILYACE